MRNFILLLLPGIFILSSGCTTLYVPAANQVHMMDQKGEIHLASGFGISGFHLHGGVAATDQIGVSAAVSYRTGEDRANDQTEKHGYGEFAISYFDFGSSTVKGEFLGGFGVGSGDRGDNNGRFNKPFIQMNTAVTTRNFVTGLSLRTAYVNFTELETTSGFGTETADLFFEPAAFVRLGFYNFMLESQLGVAWPLTEPSDLAFGYEPMRLSVGIKFLFNSAN